MSCELPRLGPSGGNRFGRARRCDEPSAGPHPPLCHPRQLRASPPAARARKARKCLAGFCEAQKGIKPLLRSEPAHVETPPKSPARAEPVPQRPGSGSTCWAARFHPENLTLITLYPFSNSAQAEVLAALQAWLQQQRGANEAQRGANEALATMVSSVLAHPLAAPNQSPHTASGGSHPRTPPTGKKKKKRHHLSRLEKDAIAEQYQLRAKTATSNAKVHQLMLKLGTIIKHSSGTPDDDAKNADIVLGYIERQRKSGDKRFDSNNRQKNTFSRSAYTFYHPRSPPHRHAGTPPPVPSTQTHRQSNLPVRSCAHPAWVPLPLPR